MIIDWLVCPPTGLQGREKTSFLFCLSHLILLELLWFLLVAHASGQTDLLSDFLSLWLLDWIAKAACAAAVKTFPIYRPYLNATRVLEASIRALRFGKRSAVLGYAKGGWTGITKLDPSFCTRMFLPVYVLIVRDDCTYKTLLLTQLSLPLTPCFSFTSGHRMFVESRVFSVRTSYRE